MASLHNQYPNSNEGFSSPLSPPPSSLPATPDSLKKSLPKIENVQNPVTGKRKRGATATTATKKAKISKPAYYGNKQQNFPDPHGQPPVWSEKRQALCEALPYYNALQSGAYRNGGKVHGFLIDSEVGERDHFTDQVVIARVGGGKTVDKETGKRVQTKSQDSSNLAIDFQKTQKENYPVVVIAGQGHSGSPSKLPHYYNILDHFHVTDVFPEQYNSITRWMVRLERINLNEKSWWSAKDAPHSPPDFISPKAPEHQCPVCGVFSKTIYKQGWVCLNADPKKEEKGGHQKSTCAAFFKFGNNVDKAFDKTLEFTKEFLEERTPFQFVAGQVLQPFVPPYLTEEDAKAIGALAFEEKCRKGIVCPQCKCCIRRIHWTYWKCENAACTYVSPLTARSIPAPLAISSSETSTKATFVKDGIKSMVMDLGLYKVTMYSMPGEEEGSVTGLIAHYKSCAKINENFDGPDELFLQLQSANLNLMRKASKNKGARNEILTKHWAHNWGAPYKYGVAQESTNFQHAPPALVNALKRLTWAGREVVPYFVSHNEADNKFNPFNEMLSIGYFEDSAMGYHDDGESTVGPTVASISLGCSSTMSWRPKSKNTLQSEKELNNKKGTKQDFLRIVLEHGDIMVMHGSGIQKYYEHSADPHGALRFALTSRYIIPEELVDDAARRDAEVAARLPEWSETYKYDGNIDAMVPV